MKIDLSAAIHSLEMVLAFDPRDWAKSPDDAWIYGIIIGWDEASLNELKVKFHWKDYDIARLKAYNKAFLTSKKGNIYWKLEK